MSRLTIRYYPTNEAEIYGSASIKGILEKLAHYEDLEEQLEKLYGGRLSLDNVVDNLNRIVQNGEEKLDYARILTNSEAEKWDKWKDLEEQGRLIEQKHGRWKIIGMRPVGTHLTHYCSICGGHGDNEMDYCPNCGAKMLKGTEE